MTRIRRDANSGSTGRRWFSLQTTRHRARAWWWGVLIAFVLITILQGCASAPDRNPLPQDLSELAQVPGYSKDIRYWGDVPPPFHKKWYTATPTKIKKMFPDIVGKEQVYLAVSGGGANGAYAVGILTGWTAAGTRPEFAMGTGISTGALIAPFAFLGPDYDSQLKEAYTTLTTKDILKRRGGLATLRSDAAADTTPLKEHIARYVTQDLVDAIAKEYKRGRRLIIGTTNLDAMRPVPWNITKIAASGNEDAADLIRTIMLASASIPAAFPPQYIPVEADGQTYDEIHVDGGTVSQAFLYPAEVDWSIIGEKLQVKGKPQAYVIRNSRLLPDWVSVDPPKTLSIAGRAASSLIRTQGIGDLYRIYLKAQRDGIDYCWTAIPDDFDETPNELFDPEYMGKLVDMGYRMATSGAAWKEFPPKYKVK